jgi:hypothetical protein
VGGQVSHQYKTTGKVTVWNILIIVVRRREDKEIQNRMAAGIPRIYLLLISI